MVMILGLDESGRGPVVGPLVICGVLIEESKIPKLEALGVKDSKLILPKTRKRLAASIKRTADTYKIEIVEPKEIDNAVIGNNLLNLNWLEAKKTAAIINELKPDRVILDCPSPNKNAYTAYLRRYLKDKDIEIIAEHKADSRFSVVGAASIIAKVTRDKEVEKIEKQVGQSIGTGYASNPICQKFLKENYDKHPGIFRKSWSTYRRIIDGKRQKRLEEF